MRSFELDCSQTLALQPIWSSRGVVTFHLDPGHGAVNCSARNWTRKLCGSQCCIVNMQSPVHRTR
jgi:hypothetical protein